MQKDSKKRNFYISAHWIRYDTGIIRQPLYNFYILVCIIIGNIDKIFIYTLIQIFAIIMCSKPYIITSEKADL